jgi:hypothetical protein
MGSWLRGSQGSHGRWCNNTTRRNHKKELSFAHYCCADNKLRVMQEKSLEFRPRAYITRMVDESGQTTSSCCIHLYEREIHVIFWVD